MVQKVVKYLKITPKKENEWVATVVQIVLVLMMWIGQKMERTQSPQVVIALS